MNQTATLPRLDDEQLDDIFAALASSTRRAMLARLAEGEASVNELAEPFAMSLPAVSKHIKVLENAGLIERTRRAQFRPCTLRPEPLAAVADWADHHRALWEDRLTQMNDYLRTLQATTDPSGSNTETRTPSPEGE